MTCCHLSTLPACLLPPSLCISLTLLPWLQRCIFIINAQVICYEAWYSPVTA
jgi:hypothetical protein